VSRYFATYNMVNAPVVDNDRRLLGAVTVDDVLDHVLPPDWRGTQLDALSAQAAHSSRHTRKRSVSRG
jgi:Mg/Co/Ni transporter MgtE